ncbi:hypothetical protein CBR_g31718 [Chara braunii]|uniref:Integrase catalytic domain-containing protein n=1 Tax=Chara braunii TaxID=69332 RepID=A0A388JY02_CHABU|nr:hypothetical protein CBR_g31718 [Chara braunii]|eukprot:GBG62701.1 hypothetical protein CBR_g31718 [Chara braunii]
MGKRTGVFKVGGGRHQKGGGVDDHHDDGCANQRKGEGELPRGSSRGWLKWTDATGSNRTTSAAAAAAAAAECASGSSAGRSHETDDACVILTASEILPRGSSTTGRSHEAGDTTGSVTLTASENPTRGSPLGSFLKVTASNVAAVHRTAENSPRSDRTTTLVSIDPACPMRTPAAGYANRAAYEPPYAGGSCPPAASEEEEEEEEESALGSSAGRSNGNGNAGPKRAASLAHPPPRGGPGSGRCLRVAVLPAGGTSSGGVNRTAEAEAEAAAAENPPRGGPGCLKRTAATATDRDGGSGGVNRAAENSPRGGSAGCLKRTGAADANRTAEDPLCGGGSGCLTGTGTADPDRAVESQTRGAPGGGCLHGAARGRQSTTVEPGGVADGSPHPPHPCAPAAAVAIQKQNHYNLRQQEAHHRHNLQLSKTYAPVLSRIWAGWLSRFLCRAKERSDRNRHVHMGEGCMAGKGSGVLPDFAEAARCFGQASRQGDPTGHFWMGWLHEEGKGVEKDFSKAVKFYKKAVKPGPTPAEQAEIDRRLADKKKEKEAKKKQKEEEARKKMKEKMDKELEEELKSIQEEEEEEQEEVETLVRRRPIDIPESSTAQRLPVEPLNWADQSYYSSEILKESEEERDVFIVKLATVTDTLERNLMMAEKRAELNSKLLASRRQEVNEKKRLQAEGEKLQKALEAQKENPSETEAQLALLREAVLNTRQDMDLMRQTLQRVETHRVEFETVWNNFLEKSAKDVDHHVQTYIQALDDHVSKTFTPEVIEKIVKGARGDGGDGDGDGDDDKKGKRKIGDPKEKLPQETGQRIPYWDRVLMATSYMGGDAMSFAISLQKEAGCNSMVEYSQQTRIEDFLKLIRERFEDKNLARRTKMLILSLPDRKWKSTSALKATMDELLQCPDHGLTPAQILNSFARALPDPLRTQLYPRTKEEGMTYEKFGKIAIDHAGFLAEANYCHYWKDLQAGKRWQNRTISGSIPGKDSLLLTFEEGGAETISWDQVDYGLDEPNRPIAQEGSYAAVAARGGGRQGRGCGRGRGRGRGGRGFDTQRGGGEGSHYVGGRGNGPSYGGRGSYSTWGRGRGSWYNKWDKPYPPHPGLPEGEPWKELGITGKARMTLKLTRWAAEIDMFDFELKPVKGRHPETNGQTEQMNKTLQQTLRMYIRPDQIDWDEHLPKVVSAYNNSVHLSTCKTPMELHLGWRPRRPIDRLNPDQVHKLPLGTSEFAVEYQKDIEKVKESILKAQHQMIEQANKHRRPSQFAVGDLVWVKSKEFAPEENISQKLLPAYRGPWQVLDVIGDVDGPSYVIEIPPHLRTYPVFHASKLLPRVTNELFPSRRSAIPPSMDGKYDIDKIVAESTYHTGRRGRPQRQYKVRFAYQNPSEDLWFTREELLDSAPHIVSAYESAKRGIHILDR